jgi:glycosyltransferase involved in cell wall biosynthesis
VLLRGRGAEDQRVRIFGWSADIQGCGYWRMELPMAELAARGHTTSVHPLLTRDAPEADVIVGQRVHLPGPTGTWQKWAREGRHLVYEIDDDLFRVDARNAVAHRWYKQQGVLDNIRANAAAASRVTVTTEPLAEVMREFNRDVRIVPNLLPSWLLEHEPPRRSDIVTVGWGGSPTHDMDLSVMEDELRRLLRKERGFEVHTMGGDYGPFMRLPADRYRWTPWVQGVVPFLMAIDFHVGLLPLRDHVFNRSKSWVTALVYAALGIPVVASDVGPYAAFVRHGETGFLVRKPGDWVRYVRDLVRDTELRESMGAAAKALAAKHTIEANAGLWEEALKP